jgi:hypothetical protein
MSAGAESQRGAKEGRETEGGMILSFWVDKHETKNSRVPQFRLLSLEQIDVKCGMGNPGNGSRTTYPIWWAIGGIGGLTRRV